MYNGSYYSTYTGAGFVSPKVALDGNDNVLSFYVYNIATAYPDNKPELFVFLRGDDGDYTQAANYVVGGDTEDGWKKYEVSLTPVKGCSFVSFAFYGYTNGHSDVIYLDNINIEKGLPTSINIAANDVRTVVSVTWHDLAGRETTTPSKGVYIRTTTYSDGSRETKKIVLK